MADRVKFDVYYGHGIVRSNLSEFAFVELELLVQESVSTSQLKVVVYNKFLA